MSTTVTAMLTVRCEDQEWQCPLLDGDGWLPLGRGLLLDDHGGEVRLPDRMAGVPRGALLLIRYAAGVLHLCRSDERREYLVDVDGRRLAPGVPHRAPGEGRISYTRGGPATGLAYQLTA